MQQEKVAILTGISTGTGFETSLALARNWFVICVCDLDMLCRNGGLIGAITNGGFAEYIEVHERSFFKIPYYMDWDLAASLACLTPCYALKEASLKVNR
jgi:D-arabinose 1-dehydrogenase-like Zn-dependent alcohol dehydrogenase